MVQLCQDARRTRKHARTNFGTEKIQGASFACAIESSTFRPRASLMLRCPLGTPKRRASAQRGAHTVALAGAVNPVLQGAHHAAVRDYAFQVRPALETSPIARLRLCGSKRNIQRYTHFWLLVLLFEDFSDFRSAGNRGARLKHNR